MKYFLFKVNNMAIVRASSGDKSNPTSGSVNYFGVEFEFDEDFSAIAGAKKVEFFKNREKLRRDLVDGKCLIPNEMLKDKGQFEMRVISGTTVATPWVSVSVSESGTIAPEEPAEDAPENMEYVKTQSGDAAVPFLRAATNGLEFSKNGKDWEGGLSGVPEVPKDSKGQKPTKYMRAHGDWVPYEEPDIPDLTELLEKVDANSTEVEKIAGMETKISEQEQSIEEIKEIEGLIGAASALTELSDGETEPATIAAKVNEIIALLKARGIATT